MKKFAYRLSPAVPTFSIGTASFYLPPALRTYYRSVGAKTVVFVFLHAGGFQSTIDGILNSFESGPHLHDAEEFNVQ